MAVQQTADAGNGTTGEGRGQIWQRGGYMLLFVIVFSLVWYVIALIALVQFLALVILREPNKQLAEFGNAFAKWVGQISSFLSCATDVKPWPFTPWPKG